MLLKKSDDGFVEMGTYPEIKEKLLQRRLLIMKYTEKYKSVKEIMMDESLSIPGIVETIEKFLSEKGMTVDEFYFETEEGNKLMEEAAEKRFTMPIM